MALSYPITNRIVIGAGGCFFAEETSSTVEGEDFRYLGDSPALSLSATTEKVEVDSSDAPVAETLVSITKKVTRAFKMTLPGFAGASARTPPKPATCCTAAA